MFHTFAPISGWVSRHTGSKRAAQRCSDCHRRLWVEPIHDPCRACCRAPEPHDAAGLTRVQGVRYGPRLRRGLDLITVSLLLIPVTPCVLMLNAAMGSSDDRMIRLGLLIMLEHGLWLVGIRVATEYAIRQPQTRGSARRARWATAADALAAMLFLLSLALALRFENSYLENALYVCLVVALVSRGVALWAGAAAIAAVLRALGLNQVAGGLRVLAALACGVAAAAATGLALVLYAARGGVEVAFGSELREMGFFLLLVGIPTLGCVAVVSGAVCTLATVRLRRRFERVAAALGGDRSRHRSLVARARRWARHAFRSRQAMSRARRRERAHHRRAK